MKNYPLWKSISGVAHRLMMLSENNRKTYSMTDLYAINRGNLLIEKDSSINYEKALDELDKIGWIKLKKRGENPKFILTDKFASY